MNTKQIKNGFTLVELLAVVVILGIIMAIGGGITMKVKKNANEEQAKQLENTIKELGPNIYSHESLVGGTGDGYFYKKYKNLGSHTDSASASSSGDLIQISLSKLSEAGYLKSETILNPSGNGYCKGYLEVKKINYEPVFKGYISCPGLYETPGYTEDIGEEVELTKIE